MRQLTEAAEKLLREILNHRLENGNCDITYWGKRFEEASAADDVLLRSLFKELQEADMISVRWADDCPYTLMLLGNGISYFDEINKQRKNQSKYMNYIYGSSNNVVIQQGNTYATQVMMNGDVDYELFSKLIDTIKKYDSALDIEYGDNAKNLREAGKELQNALSENQDKKITGIIDYIRELSINAGGGLIAAGIIEIISHIGG